MADAPPNGLFWSAVAEAAAGAELLGDRLVVDVAPAGPAGSSSVELPSGEVLEVDHLDPARLVGIESGAAGAASSPLLFALFGGDGTLHVLDGARTGRSPGGRSGGGWSTSVPHVAAAPPPPRMGRTPDELPDPWAAQPAAASRRRVRPLAHGAQRMGRMVVLADLATDLAVDPLARVVAAAEFVGSIDSTPGGDLFAPLVPGLAARVAGSAPLVGDDEVAVLDVKRAFRIAAALRPLVSVASGSDRAVLIDLVERLGRRSDHATRVVSAPNLRAYEDADWMVADAAVEAFELADEVDGAVMEGESPVQIVRRSPSVLEVTVARGEAGRWVRVLRADGLVALALAPLRTEELAQRTELLVPPDTTTEELEVQVVGVDQLGAVAGAPNDLVRRAVRAGRAAASAERLGDLHTARRRWRLCSELWHELGDGARARQARERGTSRGGRIMVDRLLTDELDPFGTEVELEGVSW